MATIVFYHYTSEDGKNAIIRSKIIKESNPTRGDARYGKGVYGNGMPPDEFTKEELAKNNYDSRPGFWEQLLDIGKVNFAVKVTLPAARVRKIKHKTRDILLHAGDIDLSRYSYEVLEVPEY